MTFESSLPICKATLEIRQLIVVVVFPLCSAEVIHWKFSCPWLSNVLFSSENGIFFFFSVCMIPWLPQRSHCNHLGEGWYNLGIKLMLRQTEQRAKWSHWLFFWNLLYLWTSNFVNTFLNFSGLSWVFLVLTV